MRGTSDLHGNRDISDHAQDFVHAAIGGYLTRQEQLQKAFAPIKQDFETRLETAHTELVAQRETIDALHQTVDEQNFQLEEARRLQQTLIGLPSKRLGELMCTSAALGRSLVGRASVLARLLDRIHRSGANMQIRADFLQNLKGKH